MEVVAGLREGDRVIVGNLVRYQPGQLVESEGEWFHRSRPFERRRRGASNVEFRHQVSILHHYALPDHRGRWHSHGRTDAGGSVSRISTFRLWSSPRFTRECRPNRLKPTSPNPFERFFTLGSGIDHIESRSLTGVSLIKIYFQPGTNADAAVSTISNLAMAQLRRLPPGTLPPVVLKFDASSLPVCLITLKGRGLNETQLHDLGQFTVRNQIANVPGASVPQPFGGKYRQIQVYVDPVKLQAHQLSLMDVVRTVNKANAILPAGDVRIGPKDFNIYTNSQLPTMEEINRLAAQDRRKWRSAGGRCRLRQGCAAIQTNIVRVDGQRSVYLPILKQGGDSNTIAIVNGIRKSMKRLVRRSEDAGYKGGIRSVGVREDRDRESW